MKIGIFTDTYYPHVNGVVTSIGSLASQLRSHGHKVFIFTTSNSNCKEPIPNVFRLPGMPFVFFPAYKIALFYSPKLIFKIKKFELDLIHTQTEFSIGIFGKLVSEFLKIPMVHTYHTMYEDYVHYIAHGNLVTPKFAKAFSRIFCNRADQVIAPTEKTKESLLSYGVKRSISVIPTGIDLDKFKNINSQELINLKIKLKISQQDYIILFLGRVAQEKSIDILINQMPNIISRIPNAKLLIVGDGLYLNSLKKLASSLNITQYIIFTGEIPWENINLYYHLADVFITASTSETQGLTYIEAMASGIPVIVKQDASIKNLITNKFNGYVFKFQDQIPEIILNLKNNSQARNLIIQNAYQTAKNFSSQNFCFQIEKIYLDLIKNNSKRLLETNSFNKLLNHITPEQIKKIILKSKTKFK